MSDSNKETLVKQKTTRPWGITYKGIHFKSYTTLRDALVAIIGTVDSDFMIVAPNGVKLDLRIAREL